MDEKSERELEQRRQAARKHGIYAIQQRGEDAMIPPQRGRFAELREQLSDRDGVITAMIDQAAKMLVMVEAAQSYVANQAKAGKPLEDITLLTRLPAFWNSTNRALLAVLGNLPGDDTRRLDITDLLKGGGSDDQDD